MVVLFSERIKTKQKKMIPDHTARRLPLELHIPDNDLQRLTAPSLLNGIGMVNQWEDHRLDQELDQRGLDHQIFPVVTNLPRAKLEKQLDGRIVFLACHESSLLIQPVIVDAVDVRPEGLQQHVPRCACLVDARNVLRKDMIGPQVLAQYVISVGCKCASGNGATIHDARTAVDKMKRRRTRGEGQGGVIHHFSSLFHHFLLVVQESGKRFGNP